MHLLLKIKIYIKCYLTRRVHAHTDMHMCIDTNQLIAKAIRLQFRFPKPTTQPPPPPKKKGCPCTHIMYIYIYIKDVTKNIILDKIEW